METIINEDTWHNHQKDGDPCVLCGDVMETIHDSHNPHPLANEYQEGRCCRVCNLEKVIPARMRIRSGMEFE